MVCPQTCFVAVYTERAWRPAAYLALWRVRACAAGAAATGLGAYLAHETLLTGRLATAAAGIAAVIGFANVVNDIADREVDAVDKPGRPIPSGRVSVRAAQTLAFSTALVAMICSAALGLGVALVMAVLLGVSALYSAFLKATVLAGNIVVAACAAVPLAFGAAVAGSVTPTVWAGCGLVFAFMVSYEILKTIADVRGDTAAGLSTVATRWGVRGAGWAYATAVAALTILAIGASRVSSHPWWYLASAA